MKMSVRLKSGTKERILLMGCILLIQPWINVRFWELESMGKVVPKGHVVEGSWVREEVPDARLLDDQRLSSNKGKHQTVSLSVLLKREMANRKVLDGRNGAAAAIYTKENLLNNVLSAIPLDINREEWIAALPKALMGAYIIYQQRFEDNEEETGRITASGGEVGRLNTSG
ncbi:hypothetical protein M8C21_023334, partial [Ambrosia artemisiifolia]